MKNILIGKRASAIILVLMLILGGCNKNLLDTTPQTLFPDNAIFSTPQRVQQEVNGLYGSVKNGQFLGGRAYIYNDIRGDQFLNVLSNGVTGLQTWNFTLVESSNEVNNLWIAAYAGINKINVFLQGLDDNKLKFVQPIFTADFLTTKLPQYQGEARFLRAVSYYYLLQYYAKPYTMNNGNNPGLPLRLLAETGFEHNDLARSTVAEVYTQILADLDFAELNLPLTYDATLNVNRAHKNAAIAFKSRVYLSMGMYDKVITEGNKIVPTNAPYVASTGVPNKLSSNILNVFAPPQQDPESIFSFPFSTLDPPGTQNQLALYYLASDIGGNGEYNLNPKGIFSDTAFLSKVDNRRKLVSAPIKGKYYLTKYPTGTPFTDNAPLIRYAEVMLNLAEARAVSTNTIDVQALALLNVVHNRSDGSKIFLITDFADANALIATIRKERTAEFIGEGIRSIDILRLNQSFPAKGAVSSVQPSDPNYIWPIPSQELSVNKLMTRN